jgi:preprotein translocase subunit SecE
LQIIDLVLWNRSKKCVVQNDQISDYQIFNMNKVTTYFRESYKELVEKVTWPSWLQLQQSTMIVLVATLLITAIVWVMDLAAQSGLKFIYSL